MLQMGENIDSDACDIDCANFKDWMGAASATLDLDALLLATVQTVSRSDYAPITIELAGRLCLERKRTGLGATGLIRRFQRTCPSGLTPAIVTGWMNLKTARGRVDHIRWIIDRYAEVPDKNR